MMKVDESDERSKCMQMQKLATGGHKLLWRCESDIHTGPRKKSSAPAVTGDAASEICFVLDDEASLCSFVTSKENWWKKI